MVLTETYTLANGVQIPKLGLGTWEISDATVARAVQDAVALGYRHIDTAQAYQNERGVGEGIRASGVPREELFVTTKLDAAIKTYAGAVAAIDGSLQALGLDYIDLLLIHSPKPWTAYHEADRHPAGNRAAWKALEDAYAAGKLRAIGVSNFEVVDLENLLRPGAVKPMVNQVLAHISNTPHELIAYCQQHHILVEAYSPIAHGELLKNQEVARLAKKYGVSVPQLAIRYCLELGLLPLPKTANPARMAVNADVNFSISPDDLALLQHATPIGDYGAFSHFPVFSGAK